MPLSGLTRAVDLWRGMHGLRETVLGPGELEFNEMSQVPEVGRSSIDIDDAVTAMREAADRCLGFHLWPNDVAAALVRVARERRYHPVRDYLTNLRWDRTLRFERVATDVLRLPASDTLSRKLLHRWFIAAAARVLDPGCKMDTVLIIVGPQGIGKSTFFSVLGGPFYGDVHPELGHRYTDGLLMLHGTSIAEWAELAGMRRASSTLVKQVVSQRVDRLRPPYGRSVIELPRTFVIVGSTNEDEFLTDDTGNRRFWVLDLRHLRTGDRINLEALSGMRDQLWAEAVERQTSGELWWLTPEDDALLDERHLDYRESDPWTDTVLRLAEALGEVTVAQILGRLMPGSGEGGWSKANEMRVGGILRRHGFRLTRPVSKGRRLRVWRRDRPVPTTTSDNDREIPMIPSVDDRPYRPDRPLVEEGWDEELIVAEDGSPRRIRLRAGSGEDEKRVGQVGHVGQDLDTTACSSADSGFAGLDARCQSHEHPVEGTAHACCVPVVGSLPLGGGC